VPQLLKSDVLKMAQMKSAHSPTAPTTAIVAQSGANSKTCSEYITIHITRRDGGCSNIHVSSIKYLYAISMLF
jgi:hypothetical protein